MSQENVEIVRLAYEQFGRGDFSPLNDFPDDFEFVTSPEMPDAGTYRGEAAVQFVKNWVASFEGMTISATEILDGPGDKVVVGILQQGRPRGSETVAVEGAWWQAVTLRDGEIVRVETFPHRGQALEAAGLRE